MIREGLSIIFESSMVCENTEDPLEDESTNEYDEWADELALIGKRRNILERKLRGIVLNFMRQDSLKDKNKPRIKDRILKRVEEKRRKHFDNLTPEDMMDKLLWTELCILIGKEWDLFQLIFNDKQMFAMHSQIINDRYDAHAKPADLADLALYRRSLSWFESCVNSI